MRKIWSFIWFKNLYKFEVSQCCEKVITTCPFKGVQLLLVKLRSRICYDLFYECIKNFYTPCNSISHAPIMVSLKWTCTYICTQGMIVLSKVNARNCLTCQFGFPNKVSFLWQNKKTTSCTMVALDELCTHQGQLHITRFFLPYCSIVNPLLSKGVEILHIVAVNVFSDDHAQHAHYRARAMLHAHGMSICVV